MCVHRAIVLWSAGAARMLGALRRLLSILVLLCVALPLAAPALAAAQDDAGLPACCRKGGKHRCAMAGMGEDASVSASQSSVRPDVWETPVERCPYCPSATPASHFQVPMPAAEVSAAAIIGTQFAAMVRTQPARRLLLERMQPMRGPPALLS